MENLKDYIPAPPYPPLRLVREAPWFKRLESRIPKGLEVKAFHRGQVRPGTITGIAPKATLSRREPYVWVSFPELEGTYYHNKLVPLRDLIGQARRWG